MEGRRQFIAAGAIAVLVTAAFFFLLLRPKMSEIATVREQIKAAQDEEALLQADLARLRGIRRDAFKLRARLASVENLLPESPQLPAFIRLLQRAATREGMELLSIAPSPPSLNSDQGVEVISVSVAVEGSFHRTEAFLAELENLDRLVEVASLAMSPRVETAPLTVTISSTLSLRMYVVPPETPDE